MHTHHGNSGDELAPFRTGISEMESALIRSVLEGSDIPCFVFGGDPYNLSRSISVPASRVEDAERALEEARNMGERMAEAGE
jgi:hypothetical protein